ncbi:MAG: hypothetical protein MJ237_06560 [bacterium]|nr:hypothetical protein [bacterium]
MVLLDKKVNLKTMIDYQEINSDVYVDAKGNATYKNFEGEFVTVKGCEGIVGALYRNIINDSIPSTEPNYPYEVQSNDLIITLRNGNKVHIEDFVKQKGESKFRYIGWGPFQQNVGKDIYAEGFVYNENKINAYNLSTNHAKKDIINTKIVGTNVNDLIDLSEFKLSADGSLVNSKGKAVTKTTINAGAGNDDIVGSAVNDTITGGVGNNELFINKNNEAYGNDIYKLTKGEELTIKNISSYNAEGEEQGINGKHSFQRFYTSGKNAVVETIKEAIGAEMSVDSATGGYYNTTTDTFDSVDRGTTYCIVEISNTEKKVSETGKSINGMTGEISDITGTIPPYYQLTLNMANEVGIGTERYRMTPSGNINFLAASTDYYSFTAASDITMRQILDAGNVYTLDALTGNYSLYGDITNFAYYDDGYVEITGTALDVTMANNGKTLYVKYAGSDVWYQAGTAGQNYFYKLNNGADTPYTGTVGSLSLLYKKDGNNFNAVSENERNALIGYVFTNSPENSTIDETATEMNKLSNIFVGNAFGGYTYIVPGSLVPRYDLGYVYYENGEKKIDTVAHAYNGKASDAEFLYSSSSQSAGSIPEHNNLYYAKYSRSEEITGTVDIANFAKNPTDNVMYEYFDYSNNTQGSVNLKDVYFENYDQEQKLYKSGKYTGNALNEVIDGNIASYNMKAMKVNAGEGNNTIVTNQGYQGNDTWVDPLLNDNIQAGSGKDIVYASAGNDTYQLGAGQNEINYNYARFTAYGADGEGYKYDDDHVIADNRLTGVVGNDTVKLTKGEQLTISDFYDKNYVTEGSYESGEGLKGKHLVELKGKDVILHRAEDYGDGAGSITIKNFAADKTNAEVSIATTGEAISLNDFEYYVDATKGYNGTKLNEIIDARGASKGVKISTGAGSDTVIGSRYNDKINVGSGNNEIVIKTNADGYVSSGTDTVNLTKGTNLNLQDLGTSEYRVVKTGNGADIQVIRHQVDNANNVYGTYILKGLGKNNDLANVTVQGNDIFDQVEVYAEKGGKVIGTKGDDKIYLMGDKAVNLTMTKGYDEAYGSLAEGVVTSKSINVKLDDEIRNFYFEDQTNTTNYFTIQNRNYINLAADELAIRTDDLSKITVTDTNKQKYDVTAYRGNVENIELNKKINHIAFLEGGNAQEITDSKKNDIIYGVNDKDNVFNYEKGGADIYYGGDGNDTYNITKFDKNVSLIISDRNGNNVLNFESGANENMTLFFDVANDGDHGNNFYFVHNDIAQNAKKVNLSSNLQLLKGMVEFDRFDLEDNSIQFGGEKVDNLAEKINYITENVQSWLLNNGNYDSAMDVIIAGNKDDIASLMQAYTCDLVNQPVPTL